MKQLPSIHDSDFDKRQSEVMDLFVKSYTPRQIAKELGLTVAQVEVYVNEWRNSTHGNKYLQDRVKDLINTLDDHFSKLIQEMYSIVKEVDNRIDGVDDKLAASLLAQKNAALSKAADFEAKRVDVLQRAGILEINDVGDQLAAMEEQHDKIIGVLKWIATEHPEIRMELHQKLNEIRGEATPIEVEA